MVWKYVLRKLAENKTSCLNFSIKLSSGLLRFFYFFFFKDPNTCTFTLLLFMLFTVKLLCLLTRSEASPTVFLCIMFIFFLAGWSLLKGQMVAASQSCRLVIPKCQVVPVKGRKNAGVWSCLWFGCGRWRVKGSCSLCYSRVEFYFNEFHVVGKEREIIFGMEVDHLGLGQKPADYTSFSEQFM